MTDVEIVLYGLMWSGGILVLNAIVVFALSVWIKASAPANLARVQTA
jgi:hypothetical protein